MTTLILSPVLALTLVSATTSVASHSAITAGSVRVTAFTVAKPDLIDAVNAATPPPAPVAPAPARPAAKPAIKTPRVATSAPVIAAPPADPNSVIGIIEAAAARWGVSGGWMVKIARCESGLRPTAYNPRGPYIGLFQFLQSTFSHNGGTNIYSAADQANIAAKMLAHGQAHQWSCA
jgi:hypothetical protein